MRERNGSTSRRFEFGDATIFVKSPVSSILDGLIRGVFICQVHPVNGPVVQLDIPAFYPWDAANKALDHWRAMR